MNINGLKQDYSFLFSGLNGAKSSNNLFASINLSDYNSIKTGTYGKLLKEYYKKEDVDTKDTASKKDSVSKVENSSAKELKEVQTEADELRDSAAALMQKGGKSVFKDEDMKKVYSAVSDFVEDFNSVVKKGEDSGSKALIRGAEGLMKLAGDYEDELSKMGITIDTKNNKLSIDKDTFMKADVDKVKELFNGQNSFAYLTSLRAVSMGNTAYSESNQSSLYNGNGNYSVPSTGDLFNSII